MSEHITVLFYDHIIFHDVDIYTLSTKLSGESYFSYLYSEASLNSDVINTHVHVLV